MSPARMGRTEKKEQFVEVEGPVSASRPRLQPNKLQFGNLYKLNKLEFIERTG